MRRRFTRPAAWSFPAVTAAAIVVAATGCTQTVDGAAERARPAVPDPGRSYGYVDDRCGLLQDETIQGMFDAESIVRPYSGAVCQYVLAVPSGIVDVVYSWFDSGTVERERALAEQRGSRITDTDIARHPGFIAQHPDNPAACAATAAAAPGVLTWWVQFRPRAATDPCEAAEQLMSATLSADM